MLNPNQQNGLGFSPGTIDGFCYARGRTFVAGEVGQLDLSNSNANVTNNDVGNAASGWANVVTPTATGVKAYPICVALAGAVDGGRTFWRMEGLTKAYVIKASGSVAKGDPLYAVSGQNYLTADGTAGSKIVARAQAALTTPTVAALCDVDMNGGNGCGVFVS